MVAEFSWLLMLINEGKIFLYLWGMCWDTNKCEMDLNSCESTWKISDPNRMKVWCQTREFGTLQVISSYPQMYLVMGNQFARVRSDSKLIQVWFIIIGHGAKSLGYHVQAQAKSNSLVHFPIFFEPNDHFMKQNKMQKELIQKEFYGESCRLVKLRS